MNQANKETRTKKNEKKGDVKEREVVFCQAVTCNYHLEASGCAIVRDGVDPLISLNSQGQCEMLCA